jgi:hypothetical protein
MRKTMTALIALAFFSVSALAVIPLSFATEIPDSITIQFYSLIRSGELAGELPDVYINYENMAIVKKDDTGIYRFLIDKTPPDTGSTLDKFVGWELRYIPIDQFQNPSDAFSMQGTLHKIYASGEEISLTESDVAGRATWGLFAVYRGGYNDEGDELIIRRLTKYYSSEGEIGFPFSTPFMGTTYIYSTNGGWSSKAGTPGPRPSRTPVQGKSPNAANTHVPTMSPAAASAVAIPPIITPTPAASAAPSPSPFKMPTKIPTIPATGEGVIPQCTTLGLFVSGLAILLEKRRGK